MIKTLLVDANNINLIALSLAREIQNATVIGVDVETHDEDRHEGLNKFNNRTRHAFDFRRITMTGFSVYCDGSDTAYYFNLSHADVENRLPLDQVRWIFESKRDDALYLAHNAPFELQVFRSVFGLELSPIVCTMQLAVTAYSPDEYDRFDFIRAGVKPFTPILKAITSASMGYTDRDHMTKAQSEVWGQITGKQSEASFSYNGFVDSISYGYGLKDAVRSFFGHEMTTYEEVLGKRKHMGELTGAETAAYGAEDAYWCVRLYHELIDYLIKTNPKVVETFFDQENPMVEVYADVGSGGLKLNVPEVYRRRDEERSNYAAELRKLRKAVKTLLPFDKPNDQLIKREAWYFKNGETYRQGIRNWANLPDSADDFQEAMRTRSPVSNAWADERGQAESTGPNFSHYMPMRVLLYDLIGCPLIVSEGKTQSDGEARGRCLDWCKENQRGVEIIECLNAMAAIDQRCKLYITSYLQLADPETSTLYPTLTSMLATRRMAMRTPNAMQLQKRGETTYVRGFFVADRPDHLIVSLDWSGIELVEIGEFSGDPGFAEAFGQLPHKDLHSKATAAILRLETGRDITPEQVKQLPRMTREEALDTFGPGVLMSLKGTEMTPSQAYKYHRGNDGGKGANFNYWYSGALSTIGEKRGWTTDQMWGAVEAYRAEFPVAEAWRVQTIQNAQRLGYVELPDHHRRTRFEATPHWKSLWDGKWENFDEDTRRFMGDIGRQIQSRANNQSVNALIQGTCATIAKRSILRIREKTKGMDVRFLTPIHDELVFSVNRHEVVPFIQLAHETMCDHPDIFKTMKLDASPSVGLTFEPWSADKAPFGQIELYEAPDILSFTPGSRLNSDQVKEVVDYLMGTQKMRMAA